MERLIPAAVAALSLTAFAHADVRVVHASVNTPKVDVFAGGSDLPSASVDHRILQNVPYFTASDYIEVPTGTYFLDVVAPSLGYAPAINLDSVRIDGDTDYTVVAAGNLENGIDTFLFEDDNTINADTARVRIIHAFDNVTVDISEDHLGVIADDFEYGTASKYFELPGGSYNFNLLTADGKTTVLDIPSLSVEAGKVYTVYATGYKGVTPQIKVTLDAQDGHASRTRDRREPTLSVITASNPASSCSR